MNLLLASGRHLPQDPRLRADAAFVAALVAAGHDVRWIVPSPDADATPATFLGREHDASAGPRLIVVPTGWPQFRAVQAHLKDVPTEAAVAREIRRELPDVVHLLHYGGRTSVNASWVSDRMGAATVVTVDPLPTLCHRGDLVHASGTSCDQWSDPDRCARCCLTRRSARAAAGDGSGPRELSAVGVKMGRALGVVRSPINPFPSRVAFLDRLELIIGGLQITDWITVGNAIDRDRMVSLGLRASQFAVLADPSPASLPDWARFYGTVMQGEVARA